MTGHDVTELRGVDANLVVVLDAILSETTTDGAARAAGMSPSALGSALGRLRDRLDDPVLVRSGKTFELTDHVRSLQPLVAQAMLEIRRTFDLRPTFDPLTSDRRFSIAASDYALGTMASALLTLLRDEAPGVSIDFSPLGDVEPVDLLRRDVVIAGAGAAVPGKRQSLFSDGFVCLVRAGHPALVDGALDLDALATVPYLQVVLSDRIVTVPDDTLASAGVAPNVAMTTSGFLTVPFLLEGTDLYGIVPARLADAYAELLGLTVAQTPLPRATLVESVYWHPSKSADPALRWLIDILRRTAEIVEFGPEASDH